MASAAPASAQPTPQSTGESKKPTPTIAPDETAFQAALEEQTKKLEETKRLVASKQKALDAVRPGNDGSKNHQQALRDQLDSIRKSQATKKASRRGVYDALNALDTQIKAKSDERNKRRAQIPSKSDTEIDSKIKDLEAQIQSGKMKLIDEKQAVATISQLNRQKKELSFLKAYDDDINALKAKKSEQRTQLDDPESKQQEKEIERLQGEMRQFKEQNNQSYNNVGRARDELQKARDEQNAQYTKVKQLKDEHYNSKREYRRHQREAAKQRDQKRAAEREKLYQEKRSAILTEKLEDARMPAYTEEINAVESLIRFIDPTAISESKDAGPSKFAAQAQRTVDASGLKGRLLSKKEDDEAYFVGTGGKKNKKGGKKEPVGDAGKSKPEAAKNLSRFLQQGSMRVLDMVDLSPPGSEEEAVKVFDELLAKRQHFLDDRDRKTNENIENARKEFEQHEIDVSKRPEADGKGPLSKPEQNSSKGEKDLDRTTDGDASETDPKGETK